MTSSLASEVAALGQTVLVLQGGGALGAYQVGVYEALDEAGIAPDWVIGTSIGAINAALIAGSKPGERIDKLSEFWSRVQNDHFIPGGLPAWLAAAMRNSLAITNGVPAFFQPNPMAFLSPHNRLGPDKAGYYGVDPLRRTLEELVDLEQLNRGGTRITVGASSVRTAEMRYFDSRDMPLAIDHILASGALPPAFPAVRIDGELYWDGGILSNTPVEVVFDDNPRRDSLVFAVHIWNPHGPEPETVWEVMNRQKDIQYSSRAASHIKRQRQLHRLRHIVAELSAMLPEDKRRENVVGDMASYGCLTRMHVVRLLAPALDHEDHSKDIDFSAGGIRRRREAGYRDTIETLDKAPWRAPVDDLEGFILHEASGGRMVETAAAREPGNAAHVSNL
jgi:NTE family protein